MTLPGQDALLALVRHAETPLRGVLAFIGVSEPEFVIAEGLALGEAPSAESLSRRAPGPPVAHQRNRLRFVSAGNLVRNSFR